MPSIKFIQLNIERDKHIPRVVPFLAEQNADIVCLQEVFERNLEELAAVAGPHRYFIPTLLWDGTPEGLCILSRHPLSDMRVDYYAGASSLIEYVERGTAAEKRATTRYAVLSATVDVGGALYRILTTHFTWTPDGAADDAQREDMTGLLAVLEGRAPFVLSGDFNAPRGQEIWGRLAERYKDNVPPQYQTSLDRSLHRAGHLDLMVDGIFSTPEYKVSDVEMLTGISDHCPLIAHISTVA